MTNDETYIQLMKTQIAGGMYDHLFKGKSDLTFLDIGANIGLVSIYAVPYCKRIVAIEPSPLVYVQLAQNTRNYTNIEPYCCALAPRDERVPFFVNDINFTASSTVNTYGQEIAVDGWTLGHILDYHRLDCVNVCKCDIEGSEDESLSFDQLKNAKSIIKTYYIETHNCPATTWEHKLGTLVGNLARCGYSKMSIDGMSLTATWV